MKLKGSADTKETIGLTVAVAVGLLVLTLVAGLSSYILGTFNKSGVTIPSTYNFFGANVPTLGVVATLLVVSIIVAIAVYIIQRLRGTAETV